MGRPPKKSAAAKPSLSESWTETQALLKDVGALSEKVVASGNRFVYTEQELELFQTLRNKLAAIRTTSKHAQDASLAMERAWGAKSAASLATPTGAALPSTSRQPEVHPQKRRQVMCQTPRSSVDEDKSKKQVDLMRGGGEAKQSSSQLPAVTSMPLQDDQAGQNWLVISCSRSLPKHVGALSSIISQLGTAPQQLSSELTTEMKTVEK